VDHSKLPLLYPALRAICDRFGEVYPPRDVSEMLLGFHLQVARVEPHTAKKEKSAKSE
jgi:hypothetical protein